jgi:hypothetical protein
MLPIIDSAVVAAPVLVQEKPQARVDVAHIPEDATTVFGKRGNDWNGLLKLLDQLGKPKDSSAARPSPSSPSLEPGGGRTDVDHSLPFNPDEPSVPSSPGHAPSGPGSLTESQYEPMDWEASVPSDSASSTMSTADHELMGAHALPNPGLSTVSIADHELMGAHALPNPGLSTVSTADHELMGAHALPNPGLSTVSTADHELMGAHALPNPGLSTVSDHEMVDALPSPIESDIEMVDVPPSRSSTNPDRQSMGVGSSSEGRKKPFRPQKTVIF